MKKLLFLFTLLLSVTMQAQDVIYVSSKGQRETDGSKEHPLDLVEAALKSEAAYAKTTKPLTIIVESGDYYMFENILLDEAYTRPIIIRGEGPTKPRLIGGFKISEGWKKTGKNLYCTHIDAVISGDLYFEQLYVNGQRAIPARTPNDSLLYADSSKTATKEAMTRCNIYLKPADLKTLAGLTPKEQKQVQFTFYHKWDNTHFAPDSFDVRKGKITGNNMFVESFNMIDKNARYYFSNTIKALDRENEWFLDTDKAMLYYNMPAGKQMDEAIAPVLENLMTIKGSPTQHIKNLTFENLHFQITTHLTPSNGDMPQQSAYNWSAAIELSNADSITFQNCDVSQTGGYGIWMKEGCNDNKVIHCNLTDLGAGGVKIGVEGVKDASELSKRNTVENNIIHSLGRVMPCAAGVLIMQSSNNQILHNDIADLFYTGISVGWVWGYDNDGGKYSYSVGNKIAYNHIHHIGWGLLSDMAGIYTLGQSPGTEITGNVINDVLSFNYGGWGIYLDEGSSYIHVYNNLVSHCKQGGFHQHYGQENIVENNIFAYGTLYQIQFTRPEKHLSFTFRSNIILQNSGTTLSGNFKEGQVDFHNNLYWNQGGKFDFEGQTWDEWQKDHDKGSIVADPQFVNPEQGNFTFKSASGIKRIHFQPFDYTQAGVYGSAQWKQKAELSQSVVKQFQDASKRSTVNSELFKKGN